MIVEKFVSLGVWEGFLDFSHAKLQTVHVAVCEGVTQTVTGVFADREVQTDKPAVRELLVQTDALKRSDRFTQANDTTTEKYVLNHS